MPSNSPTRPTTTTLSDTAKLFVRPEGIVTSSWPKVERRLAEMAITYDPWQSGAVRTILGRDESDRYACTIGGVTMSLPRQVGKTFTIGSLLVALCTLYPGLRAVWTSHHGRTTTNTFRSMQAMVRRKKIAPHIRSIRTANGEQEITFTNGSIIMFGAREHGFGVGIDAIDILVCDEAQRLHSKTLADMMPTTNQAKHKHGALVFFIGTPPRPTDTGDEFTARRRKAASGEMKNGVYIELGADEDADLNDPEQWAKANPSYPHRTPHESMLRLRENLTDDGDWRREAMGIWDDADALAARVIMADEWKATGVKKPPPAVGTKSLGVKFAADGSRVAVSGALKPAEGPVHIELVGDHSGTMAAGTASLVQWVAARWRDYAAIVIDGKSHAGTFVNALIEAGVSKKVIVTPTWPEVATANGMLLDAVLQKQLTHLATAGQALLDQSVAHTTKKIQAGAGGGAWSWLSIAEPGDEVPIASAALAHWGVKTKKPKTGRAVFA
jgi:hypothetical protein